MTTIAVKDGCMAADTRVTSGGAYYHANKIFRIGHSLFGTAGDGDMGLVMVEWLKTARNRTQLYKNWPENCDRYEVFLLELNPTGVFLWSGWGVPERLNESCWAIGSGQLAALQAMKSGSTAQEAVKAATVFDECSGPPIQAEYLKQKRKR